MDPSALEPIRGPLHPVGPGAPGTLVLCWLGMSPGSDLAQSALPSC